VYDFQAQKSTRVTTSSFYWNKHPSWSPDGKKIVFWSNRTGRPQIWVMDADGKNPANLSNSLYNDINPIWIK
jgi:TolB protein